MRSLSEPADRTTRLASLFVDGTGQSSVAERQRDEVPIRVDERAAPDVARYVADSAGADGLADAIGDPETARPRSPAAALRSDGVLSSMTFRRFDRSCQ